MSTAKLHVDLLVQAAEVSGKARDEYERAYFEWLLASLADALRQVVLAPQDAFTFERRRELVLALLDEIEDAQQGVLSLFIVRSERDQPPHDRGRAGVGRSPLSRVDDHVAVADQFFTPGAGDMRPDYS